MIIGVSVVGLIAVFAAGRLSASSVPREASSVPREGSVVAAARGLIAAQKNVPSCSELVGDVLGALAAGDVR